ncbi:hypothetical protein GOODEAATRI_013502, partial [Goodea atripinnis]
LLGFVFPLLYIKLPLPDDNVVLFIHLAGLVVFCSWVSGKKKMEICETGNEKGLQLSVGRVTQGAGLPNTSISTGEAQSVIGNLPPTYEEIVAI